MTKDPSAALPMEEVVAELRRLLADAKLPWRVDEDWAFELRAADNRLIGKFVAHPALTVSAVNALPRLLAEREALMKVAEAAEPIVNWLNIRHDFSRGPMPNPTAAELRALCTALRAAGITPDGDSNGT